ncbi:hypothetical protein K0B04_03580 [Patescibacteria group bacterium]|nr:hypothetical protein [Patescibacteria group bacterium]
MNMREAFDRMAQHQLSLVVPRYDNTAISKVGAEVELFLYKSVEGKNIDATEEERDTVLSRLDSNFGFELGASCIEIHPNPVDLNHVGFSGWSDQIKDYENKLIKEAGKLKLVVGRGGTIPWIDTTKIARTTTPKYLKVPDFHNINKREGFHHFINGVDVSDAAIVGILNAFQFSIECFSLEHAVDTLNRLYMISPMSVALSANARYLNGVDTGWEDVRFEAWRISHDTRTEVEVKSGKPLRIGLPDQYFINIEDYLEDVSSYPFILEDEEHAFQIGIGLYWRDARIKFIDNKPIVEFRPLSTQPSIEDEMEISAFTIGRLVWSQKNNEPLIPIRRVWLNKISAEKNGIRGNMYTTDYGLRPTSIAISEEIEKAKKGLEISGIPDWSVFTFDSYKKKIENAWR